MESVGDTRMREMHEALDKALAIGVQNQLAQQAAQARQEAAQARQEAQLAQLAQQNQQVMVDFMKSFGFISDKNEKEIKKS